MRLPSHELGSISPLLWTAPVTVTKPVHGRPAEVEGDGVFAIRLSSVGRGIAGHPDVFAWIERGDPKSAPCSPLACETVAQSDLSRIA